MSASVASFTAEKPPIQLKDHRTPRSRCGALYKTVLKSLYSSMRELHEIVLASVSPRRRELLASLGLRVIVVPSEIDEGHRQGFRPPELAQLHADAKAQAVAARELAHVILAADTVVDLDGVSLGKPRDRAEAAAMLGRLAGREHLVHTAYALVAPPGGRRLAETVTTRVRFYPLGPDEIHADVAARDPLEKR